MEKLDPILEEQKRDKCDKCTVEDIMRILLDGVKRMGEQIAAFDGDKKISNVNR